MAIWQIKAGDGGIEGSLVSTHAISGLDASARVTCFASLRAADAVVIAGALLLYLLVFHGRSA